MPNEPKLHHYVPQFYLRQWCDDDGKLIVYPLDGRAPFRTTPRNVAAECGLYTPTPGAVGVRDDHEQWFSGWEGLFAGKWPDIFDRADNPRTRRNLARFLGTLLIRHPASRDIVGEVNQRLLALVENAPDDARIAIRGKGRDVQVSAAEVRQLAVTGRDEVRTDWLRQMPAVAGPLGDTLFSRRWGVIFSTEPAFITSDNPVALARGACRNAKFGVGTAGTLVFFPISPMRFLVIADEWEHPFMHYRLDDERVFIRRVVRGAERFVFSPREHPAISAAISENRASRTGE